MLVALDNISQPNLSSYCLLSTYLIIMKYLANIYYAADLSFQVCLSDLNIVLWQKLKLALTKENAKSGRVDFMALESNQRSNYFLL